MADLPHTRGGDQRLECPGGYIIDRRQFCRSAVATGVAASNPWLFGCARQADTSIAAVSLNGAEIELEAAAIRELGESLMGPVLLSGHPQYDSARMIWNGMHDKRPALIARCMNAEDVSHAVTFARARELLVAVRGGGHSWPGKSVCDGGLMIDLSRMSTVSVDPVAQRAHAQGGALLIGLDTAAREHGLITTAGVVSHTGVGGYTLGGGFGRLNRKFGLTIDNLKSAEIVTADGQVRRINDEEDADLFWAIRGGGGNFGVVTEFEYQLHPFELAVLSGNIVWPIEQAREVLDFYADWYAGLSDDLYVAPAMMTTPEGQGVLVMEVVYAADPVSGERELAPLLGIGQPFENGVDLNDYMVMQTSQDAAAHPGIRSYAKNGMVREITPAFVDAMIEAYRPDPRIFLGSPRLVARLAASMSLRRRSPIATRKRCLCSPASGMSRQRMRKSSRAHATGIISSSRSRAGTTIISNSRSTSRLRGTTALPTNASRR